MGDYKFLLGIQVSVLFGDCTDHFKGWTGIVFTCRVWMAGGRWEKI